MFLFSRIFIGTVLLLLGSMSARAEDASKLFERYKSVSGGDQWERTGSLRSIGTLGTGGLEGRFEAVVDLARRALGQPLRSGPDRRCAGV